ncbi:unnamed protein product [Phytophthora lilii]|uniref:Unnamed protein product n=1 Tax=Phytophthora lilii TaxID=2077276 RepID=A0A9W7D7T8_9STRA|nr:unnamed protein product [Phytophthora lilii]
MEASLRRMEDVAMSPSSDLHKPREAPVQELTSRSPSQAAAAQVPVCPMDSVTPTQPLRRLPSRTVPSVKTIVGSGEAKPKRKRIRLKTPRRREQCRNNQARYRKKQAEYAKGLELTVEQLKQEISVLEMQHSRLVSSAKTSAWYVVVEYFHIFYNGARSTRQISSGPEAWLQKSEAQQQLAFLQSSMSDDVVVGDQRGVNALLEQWKRYTSYFDDLQFQLDRMTRISEDSIVAAASLNVTISELTFQRVFPNLLARHEGSSQEHKIALLRSKMLGQRLYLPCRLCFEWDETSKRVVRMERTVDFLTPLLQVVETIADATFVLENSLVSQDGTIREK